MPNDLREFGAAFQDVETTVLVSSAFNDSHMIPRLTIGIPHLDRTDMLGRAIGCCLAQEEPIRVIVSDQGRTDETARMMMPYCHHHDVWHVQPQVSSLRDNWAYVARLCDTEYFAWLQDDDVIFPRFSRRVVRAFEAFPEALTWMAQLKCSTDARLGYWCSGNGPWLPMDHDRGIPDEWEGEILPPTMYFTSWSLSPAVAFRNGPEFRAALDEQPHGCDIFMERTVLASMGLRGRFVADPSVVGYWMQHGEATHDGNESRKQHADQARQTGVLVDWLDDLMDRIESWEHVLTVWARLMPTPLVVGWINQLGVTQSEGKPGRYAEQVKAILLGSLEGRIELVEQPAAVT